MNDFIRILKDRRSVRQYIDKPIEKRILEEIVDCARLAPSARGIQHWVFLVVMEEENLSKLSEIVNWGSFIKDASACVVVCGKRDVKRRVEDCCLAAENIMLAAKSLGIGSCYVAALGKEIDKARDLLNIPEDFEIICFISLGYFENNPEPHDKKKLEEVIRWEKF
jgi:nitroreductase